MQTLRVAALTAPEFHEPYSRRTYIMWLTLAFTSAALLGFYDVAKKKSLTGNAVLPVLLLNTLFSSLVFLPALLSAECGLGWFEGTVLEASPGTLHAHGLVALKSVIVLTSWIFGYFGMKHLPITIVGPINATRPSWCSSGPCSSSASG